MADYHILEGATPIRDSLIWKLQTSFYDKINIRCWSESIVPNYVTSNCFIAHAYARAILGFIRDWYLRSPEAVPEEPVYIIEVGTGHGKMSFLMLRALVGMREFWPAGVPLPFKYIMSDFTVHNVNFWKEHAPFKPFIDEGLLDMAVFDAETTKEIRLELSGDVISPKSCHNPMVAICNYVFDTLKQDAFRVVDGQLQEALCIVQSREAEADPIDPGVIARMRCAWEYRDCTPEIYTDTHMQQILRYYQSLERDVSFLVPVGGIGVINRLCSMTSGKVFLLAGDKAYNHTEEMVGLRDPHIAVHGSFSMMVNFDAVRVNVLSRGGRSFHTPYLDGFKCSAFVLGVGKEGKLPELKHAWLDYFHKFGPENFSTLQRCVKDETPNATLKTALTILRLSRYDSDIFFKFRHVFLQHAPLATEKLQRDVYSDIVKMFANYYPLQRVKDIGFEVAHLLMKLKMYSEAIPYFKLSAKNCGEHHVNWYNMGICHYYTQRLEDALRCFSRSVEMSPEYHDARGWVIRVKEMLKTEKKKRLAAKAQMAAEMAARRGAAGGAGAGEGGDTGSAVAEAEGAAAGAAAASAGDTATPEDVDVAVVEAPTDGGAAGGAGTGAGAGAGASPDAASDAAVSGAS